MNGESPFNGHSTQVCRSHPKTRMLRKRIHSDAKQSQSGPDMMVEKGVGQSKTMSNLTHYILSGKEFDPRSSEKLHSSRLANAFFEPFINLFSMSRMCYCRWHALSSFSRQIIAIDNCHDNCHNVGCRESA